jgi:hypothetical protein
MPYQQFRAKRRNNVHNFPADGNWRKSSVVDTPEIRITYGSMIRLPMLAGSYLTATQTGTLTWAWVWAFICYHLSPSLQCHGASSSRSIYPSIADSRSGSPIPKRSAAQGSRGWSPRRNARITRYGKPQRAYKSEAGSRSVRQPGRKEYRALGPIEPSHNRRESSSVRLQWASSAGLSEGGRPDGTCRCRCGPFVPAVRRRFFCCCCG